MTCRERILSNDYADGVVDFPVETLLDESSDACFIPLDDRYSVVYQNRAYTDNPAESPYQYRYTPQLYGLMEEGASGLKGNHKGENGTEARGELHAAQQVFDPTFLVESGIRQLQGAPLQLNGWGTVIAIIDTGIDYTNPAFLDQEGNSRILAVWDQTDQGGKAPEGYYFGSEYTREDINRALREENPRSVVPVTDVLRHGSIMAGIAGGSRLGGGSTYLGAAPEADLVIVKLKEAKNYLRDYYFVPSDTPAYSESDIMLGIKYADSFGESFRRPVVICLGMGTNAGDHAGNSMLAGYLNRIAEKRSRVVVVCGGNEGNTAHHYMGRLEEEQGEILPDDVEIRVGDGERGFFLEFWGTLPDTFNVAVRSPGGETIPPLRLGPPQTGTYQFIFERTVFTIQSILVEAGAGEQLILFRVQDPTAGIWNFRIIPTSVLSPGNFHMWLPIREFLTAETYFLQPEPDITMTSPSLASNVISVASYDYRNNSLYLESGRGYSREGSVKPDFAAPGVNIPTLYGERTGSSLAAAVAAGAAAQFLQWAVVEGNNPLASTQDVKNYLIRGAVRDPGQEYPNRAWGYGRLNALGAFEVLRS